MSTRLLFFTLPFLLEFFSARCQISLTDKETGFHLSLNSHAVGLIICDSMFGTGFVVDGPSNVITCAHVVNGSKSIKIRFTDNSVFNLEIKKIDTISDLALLSCAKTICQRPLQSVNFSTAKCNSRIICFGVILQPSDSLVNISPAGSKIRATGKLLLPNDAVVDFIEYVGIGEPGSSGGPVIDESSGKVIAIMRSVYHLFENGGSGTRFNRAVGYTGILGQ